ncbi:MAG: hypothetical protein HY698_09170 [Deltaproteobacteria bacterium]|nr:hypothetical protein [Deltaproteobacteria bacterium]
MRRCSLLGLAIILQGILLGCHRNDVIATSVPCQGPLDCLPQEKCVDGECRPRGQDAGVRLDSGPEDFCSGEGPLILVGDSRGTKRTCSGGIAETTFRYAMCTCDAYATSTSLVTDSFDSSRAPYVPGGKAGSVGVNGAFTVNGTVDVGGSLWVGSPLGIFTAAGPLSVKGELHDNGVLRGAEVTVDHHAWVAGDIDVASLAVGGTLTLPEEKSLVVRGERNIQDLLREPVSVPPPCACSPEDLVDISAYVEAHRQQNDNATIPLSKDALSSFSGKTTLRLPCGRFFLEKIEGSGELTLEITGRTALFVGGTIHLEDAFHVTVEKGAELDLFVSGIIESSAEMILGSPDRPAKLRLYVGSSESINLSANAQLAGNLYAPLARLAISGGAEIYGSVFVRSFANSAPVTIHYDESVLRAGDKCPDPEVPTCKTCLDCRNQACHGGTCGQCKDSSECCSPLVCLRGACVPQIE